MAILTLLIELLRFLQGLVRTYGRKDGLTVPSYRKALRLKKGCIGFQFSQSKKLEIYNIYKHLSKFHDVIIHRRKKMMDTAIKVTKL